MSKLSWFVALALLIPASLPRAANPPPTQEEASALLQAGKRAEALKAFEAIIAAKPPDPTPAMYSVASINLDDGNPRAAVPVAEQLVKLRPASFQAWEVMVQAYQAVDDKGARDSAIQSLYSAWRSAIDRSIRSRVSFIRDRIIGPKHTLLAQETLDPGGDDVLRYLFQPAESGAKPDHLILLRSDNATNERWRENGTVSYDTLVYHLDTVELLPGGRSRVVPYAFYVEPPTYDRVRDLVVAILAGTAQPLSGETDPFWAGEPAR